MGHIVRFARSAAFRLALIYVAVSIGVLVLFAAPFWYAWRQNVEQVRTELLRDDVRGLVDIFEDQGSAVLTAVINSRMASQHVATGVILFADPNLRPLAGNLATWPKEAPNAPGVQKVTISEGGRSIHALLMRAALPGGYNLLVGRDDARFRPLEALFLYGLVGAAGILIIAALVGGLLIRRTLLSEVNHIREATRAIVDGDLTRRLPIRGESDELDLLVQTVNGMLDQIEQLFHGVRDVSNAIAHDLRTPLAELRSRLEELSTTRPGAEITFAEIDGAVADVDRVIGIFNALLRLSEIDTGSRRSGFVPVDVAEIARQAAEFYQPVAELSGVRLAVDARSEARVAGDPLLLAQAVSNLVENALKYGAAGGEVAITVENEEGHVRVTVADHGPGIGEEERARVVERFYRGDASRGTPGAGLGLSLVASVAKLHGGRLNLGDNHPGLRAVLSIEAIPVDQLRRKLRERLEGTVAERVIA